MSAAIAHEPTPSAGEVLLEGFLQLETPEGFRAELIEGEIVVSPLPGGPHEHNIWRLARQVDRQSAVEMDFSGNKGLLLKRGGLCPKNHVIPDGVFAPLELDLFVDAEPWMPGDGVALVVEVTSAQADRDRIGKRHCYAKAAIPLYLLVDRERQAVSLFSEPAAESEDYREEFRVPFEKPLPLPEPFSLVLDTADLI